MSAQVNRPNARATIDRVTRAMLPLVEAATTEQDRLDLLGALLGAAVCIAQQCTRGHLGAAHALVVRMIGAGARGSARGSLS